MLGSPVVTAVAPTLDLGTTVGPGGRLVPICLGGRFQWGLGASPFSWSFLVCAGYPLPQAWPCSGSGLFSSFGFPFLLPSGGWQGSLSFALGHIPTPGQPGDAAPHLSSDLVGIGSDFLGFLPHCSSALPSAGAPGREVSH